jgi:Chaperone for protein-folding within the ER, fungal
MKRHTIELFQIVSGSFPQINRLLLLSAPQLRSQRAPKVLCNGSTAHTPYPATVQSCYNQSPWMVDNWSRVHVRMINPCTQDTSNQNCSRFAAYARFFKCRITRVNIKQSYQSLLDPYHNIQRLNLFKFDGSPMVPMFLVYNPPQMLPTQTLNPTASSTGGATSTGKSRVRRNINDASGEGSEPLNKKPNKILSPNEPYNPDTWWWVGVGMTALGTIMYMMPTST